MALLRGLDRIDSPAGADLTRGVWLLPKPPEPSAPQTFVESPTRQPLTPPVAPRPPMAAAPPAIASRSEATTALDLRLPKPVVDEAIDFEPASPQPGELFHRGLARRLAVERQRRDERAAIAANVRARDGLDADAYRRDAALGEKVKTDGGCFELREDPGTGETRWWREACTDTRRDETAWPTAP